MTFHFITANWCVRYISFVCVCVVLWCLLIFYHHWWHTTQRHSTEFYAKFSYIYCFSDDAGVQCSAQNSSANEKSASVSISLFSIILIRRNNLNIKAIYASIDYTIVLIVLTVLMLSGDYNRFLPFNLPLTHTHKFTKTKTNIRWSFLRLSHS